MGYSKDELLAMLRALDGEAKADEQTLAPLRATTEAADLQFEESRSEAGQTDHRPDEVRVVVDKAEAAQGEQRDSGDEQQSGHEGGS